MCVEGMKQPKQKITGIAGGSPKFIEKEIIPGE
jgi:hypothetical protein